MDDLLAIARRVTRVLCGIALLIGLTSGAVVSEVRDSQRLVTTHWCPMHPDVRGAAGDRCRLCNMPLVPMAAADYEPYHLELDIKPRVLKPRQKTRLRFTVRSPRTHELVTRFTVVHERVFHLFILSDDHSHFAHVHPTLTREGALEVDVELPRAGVYRLIADFTPEGGTPQLLQHAIVTAGYTGTLLGRDDLQQDVADKTVGRSVVALTTPEPIAGREQLLTFDVRDAATGAPAHLQPYLGATGHLLLVSADLNIAFHAHPIAGLSTAAGPTVVFQVLFPRAGHYKLWAQFQRDDVVVTAPFVVSVSARE